MSLRKKPQQKVPSTEAIDAKVEAQAEEQTKTPPPVTPPAATEAPVAVAKKRKLVLVTDYHQVNPLTKYRFVPNEISDPMPMDVWIKAMMDANCIKFAD